MRHRETDRMPNKIAVKTDAKRKGPNDYTPYRNCSQKKQQLKKTLICLNNNLCSSFAELASSFVLNVQIYKTTFECKISTSYTYFIPS